MAHAARYIDAMIRGVRLGTQSTLTGAVGSQLSYYAKDITDALEHEMLPYDVQRVQEAVAQEALIVGPQKGEFGFKLPLRGGKTSAAAAGESPIITLGQYCGMSVHQLAGGADKVTGGSSSTMTCLDADDPGWAVGDFVLVNANEGVTDDLQLRYITRIQSAAGTTTVTVAPDFDTTPVNLDSFYAVDVLVPGPGKASTYIGGYVYRGDNGGDDKHQAFVRGCAGTFEIEETAVGALPWVTFKYMVDNWTVSEASVAQAEDLQADPFPWKSDNFYLGAQAVDIHSFAFNPGMEVVPLVGQDAQGRIGWRHKQGEPAFSLTPYHDNQFWTDYAAGTSYVAFLQSIVDSKQAWGMCIPALQLAKVGREESVGEGMMGAGLETKVVNAGLNADSTRYPMYSICLTGETT